MRKLRLELVMYTCPERRLHRERAFANLADSDWKGDVVLVVDEASGTPSLQRMQANYRRALSIAGTSRADFVLLIEDDIAFNVHLEHNLEQWVATFDPSDVGSLYETYLARDVGNQAMVTTPANWLDIHAACPRWLAQPYDVALRRHLTNRLKTHSPSLVQHAALSSTCGHVAHRSLNFDTNWRAP